MRISAPRTEVTGQFEETIKLFVEKVKRDKRRNRKHDKRIDLSEKDLTQGPNSFRTEKLSMYG